MAIKYLPNVVYLHQFPRWKYSPNASPFCVKLETYLRLARIPYSVVSTTKGSKATGKLPYIRLNDVEMTDSEFIIEHLVRSPPTFVLPAGATPDLDLEAKLAPATLAVGVALQRMLDENTYWALVYHRWIDSWPIAKEVFLAPNVPRLALALGVGALVQRRVRTNLVGHGMGRHSSDKVLAIALRDLGAVSHVLGDRAYILGDRPSRADAAAFAVVGAFFFTPFPWPELRAIVDRDMPNLEAYVNRLRADLFPDWEHMAKDADAHRVYQEFPVRVEGAVAGGAHVAAAAAVAPAAGTAGPLVASPSQPADV